MDAFWEAIWENMEIKDFYLCGLLMCHFSLLWFKYISACSGVSPPATTVFLIFLIFEALLFGIFTAIMCGTQVSAICSDETVSIQINILRELVNGMLKRLLKYIYMYFTLLGRYFTIQYLLGLSLISITLKILGDHCHQKIYQVIATSNANYSLGDDGEIWFKFLDTFDLFTGNWKS